MKTETLLFDRQSTEQSVLDSEQRYERLLASMTDYVYTITIECGRPLATSHGPGCETVTGYTPGEFDADPSLWYRMVFEEDRPAVLAQAERVLNGETPASLEHRIVHRNGRIRWIRNTPVPRKDHLSRLVGCDGLVSDITERKRAEAMFRELLESAPDAMVIVNETGIIVLVNAQTERMFGYRRQELYGQPVELLMPERFRQRHVDLRRAYSADPHVRPIAVESTLCGRCKDGSEFPAEISLSPLATEAGILISCTLRDITARRQAEVHLQRINAELIQNEESLKRMVAELKTSHGELKATQLQLIQAAKLESVGTLAAGVAHEVKNPLQTVVMGLDYLDRNFPVSNQDIAPVLSDMREAVRRASSIIQELLELSIPADFALRQEDLNPLVEHTLWLLNNEILASQVTVVRDLAATLPRVVIDKRKMEQVFINLLINALQAMSQGGVLTVATRAGCFGDDFKLSQPAFPQIKRGDSLVVVEVQDSGPGIPEADLPRIFDPFFTTKPPGVGTGLGLSVAKKIIEFHSGAIDIKNGPNGGVLVTLILPTERKNEL